MTFIDFLFSPKGRITRGQFWLAQAFFLLIFGTVQGMKGPLLFGGITFASYAIALIYLLLIISFMIIAIKRLHDMGESEYWTFISLIPVIGQIWILWWLGTQKGTEGPNEHGPNPLQIHASTEVSNPENNSSDEK